MNRTILWIMNVFCFLITIDVLPVDFQWENYYIDKVESKWYYFYDNNVLVEGYFGPVRSNINLNEESEVTAVSSETVPCDRLHNCRYPLNYTSYTYANSQTQKFLWKDQDNSVIATEYSVIKDLRAVENTITWKTNLSYDISETQFYKTINSKPSPKFIDLQMILTQLAIFTSDSNSREYYRLCSDASDFQNNWSETHNGYRCILKFHSRPRSNPACIVDSVFAINSFSFPASLEIAKLQISVNTQGENAGYMFLSEI